MSTPGLLLLALSLLAANVGTAATWIEDRAPQQNECFVIHVRLNGRPLDGPRVITLKGNSSENSVPLEDGCSKLPPAMLTEKALDVAFTVPGSRVHLSEVATGFFAGPWDVYLEDR